MLLSIYYALLIERSRETAIGTGIRPEGKSGSAIEGCQLFNLLYLKAQNELHLNIW